MKPRKFSIIFREEQRNLRIPRTNELAALHTFVKPRIERLDFFMGTRNLLRFIFRPLEFNGIEFHTTFIKNYKVTIIL